MDVVSYLPMNVFVLVRALQKHTNVVDGHSFSLRKVDIDARFHKLLNGDFTSTFLGLQNETMFSNKDTVRDKCRFKLPNQ